jgi:hypothetical protein
MPKCDFCHEDFTAPGGLAIEHEGYIFCSEDCRGAHVLLTEQEDGLWESYRDKEKEHA